VQIDRDLYPWITVGALAWGLLDCFFGYRIFKVTIAVLGAVIGALVGQLAAQSAGLGDGAELAGVFVGALLGAGLAFLLYIAAVFLAGFGFGATLGLLLLAHFNHGVALVASLVLGVIGGYAAVKLQKVLIILATALMGSFRAVLALSYFTSQIDWLFYFQQPRHLPALIDHNAWIFPSVLVLAAVGTIAQFEIGGGPSGGKKKKPAKEKAE
jgi:hypothetical protein